MGGGERKRERETIRQIEILFTLIRMSIFTYGSQIPMECAMSF